MKQTDKVAIRLFKDFKEEKGRRPTVEEVEKFPGFSYRTYRRLGGLTTINRRIKKGYYERKDR